MDIAQITRYAMQDNLFRQIVGGGDANIVVNRNGNDTTIELTTTDILIGNFEGCIGVKTGNTEIGGPCFSGAYQDSNDGDTIYTIVLKAQDETLRFVDTQELFNWYIKNKVSIDLTDTGKKETMNIDEIEKQVGVVAYLPHNQWVNCSIPTTLKDEDKLVPVLSCAGNVHLKIEPEEVSGDFKAGDKAGDLILTQHNKEIARLDLICIFDQPAPNIFQSIGVAFDRLGRNISGENNVSKSTILANCDKVNKMNKKLTKEGV